MNSAESGIPSVLQINFNTDKLGLPMPRSSWLTSAVLIPESSANSLMVSEFSLR